MRDLLDDPGRPLYITEGSLKADSAVSHGLCCISLQGVWGFRGSNAEGGKAVLADWESIALNGRRVYIAFDSDVMSKPQVHGALARLKAFLESRGANVSIIYLPAGGNGEKVGIDDYFAAGHTAEELAELTSPDLKPAPEGSDSSSGPYKVIDGWTYFINNKGEATPICNFAAKITSEIIRDDGLETETSFAIEGRAANGTQFEHIELTASTFSTMNWPLSRWGVQAVVSAGFGLKDRVREAIQALSGKVPSRRVYTHTGWQKIGDIWVFLHAEGGIGPDGTVGPLGAETSLDQMLRHYMLPDPPEGEALTEAVLASLGSLDAVAQGKSIPLLASAYRAPLGGVDFSVHFAGPTGVGKTELAALAQQHFGASMDSRNLPGSWSSTANALEASAFLAKDCILVIDDFAPGGTVYDLARQHREADRVLRAQGNKSGRARMRPDASLRPTKSPRCLIISTGEEVPKGQSLRARLLIVEISPGDVNWDRLSECQRDASAGKYTQALSAYLRWLSPRYAAVQETLKPDVNRLAAEIADQEMHRRTARLVADLAIGFRYFLDFALESGAITNGRWQELWEAAKTCLVSLAKAQTRQQEVNEPTERFRQLLAAAVISGRAHLAGLDGKMPANPEAWGWRASGNDWRSQGSLVGWVCGNGIYLEPEASYTVAQRFGRDGGEALSVTAATLQKRLHERKWLLAVEANRDRLTVRKTIEGVRRPVLVLPVEFLQALGSEPALLSQPTQEAPPTEEQQSIDDLLKRARREYQAKHPQEKTYKRRR